jgi:hypothetical protein
LIKKLPDLPVFFTCGLGTVLRINQLYEMKLGNFDILESQREV